MKWHDFQQSIASSYQDLRNDTDFSDVTLVCEEDMQLEAHRTVLIACSPFFRTILKKNKHSHPMIYIRGLNARDLVAVVDFIYYGKVNINQEDLERFLDLAEELQLKGLAGAKESRRNNTGNYVKDQKQQNYQRQRIYIEEKLSDLLPPVEESGSKCLQNNAVTLVDTGKRLLAAGTIMEEFRVKIDDSTGEPIKMLNQEHLTGKNGQGPIYSHELLESDAKLERNITQSYSHDIVNMVKFDADKIVVSDITTLDLKEKVDSLMERADDGQNKWMCTICGKTTKGSGKSTKGILCNARNDMRRHIETHMKGMLYPCKQCGVVTRSSSALKQHIYRHRRTPQQSPQNIL